jgi:hypothetical protein
MPISSTTFKLSVFAALAMAIASTAGIFFPNTYAQESISWAVQGIAQDVVNLIVVFPIILTCAYQARKGAWQAKLLLLGGLVYIIYSYLIYAFFVHFGPCLPIYIAALSLSSYALLSSFQGLDQAALLDKLDKRYFRAASAFMVAIVSLFGLLWLKDISTALLGGFKPLSLVETGLPVNPVHVLDLALLLPAMAIAAYQLRQGKGLGAFMALPLLVFAAFMGIAIIQMMLALGESNFLITMTMLAVVLTDIFLLVKLLKAQTK